MKKSVQKTYCLRAQRRTQKGIAKRVLSEFGYGGPKDGPNPTAISVTPHKKRHAALVRAHKEGGWTRGELIDRLQLIYTIRKTRSIKQRIKVDIDFLVKNPAKFAVARRRRPRKNM